jgi:hypothetical protein
MLQKMPTICLVYSDGEGATLMREQFCFIRDLLLSVVVGMTDEDLLRLDELV